VSCVPVYLPGVACSGWIDGRAAAGIVALRLETAVGSHFAIRRYPDCHIPHLDYIVDGF
jgi:hypothetical protein